VAPRPARPHTDAVDGRRCDNKIFIVMSREFMRSRQLLSIGMTSLSLLFAA